MEDVDAALNDEGQQYGNLDEASAVARVPRKCLAIWCGDHKQTLGELRKTDEARSAKPILKAASNLFANWLASGHTPIRELPIRDQAFKAGYEWRRPKDQLLLQDSVVPLCQAYWVADIQCCHVAQSGAVAVSYGRPLLLYCYDCPVDGLAQGKVSSLGWHSSQCCRDCRKATMGFNPSQQCSCFAGYLHNCYCCPLPWNNHQNGMTCFGNYLLGLQSAHSGFLPVFWNASTAYMHAATVMGCLKYGMGAQQRTVEMHLRESSINSGPDDNSFSSSVRRLLANSRGVYPPVAFAEIFCEDLHSAAMVRRLHLIVVDLDHSRHLSKRVFQQFVQLDLLVRLEECFKTLPVPLTDPGKQCRCRDVYGYGDGSDQPSHLVWPRGLLRAIFGLSILSLAGTLTPILKPIWSHLAWSISSMHSNWIPRGISVLLQQTLWVSRWRTFSPILWLRSQMQLAFTSLLFVSLKLLLSNVLSEQGKWKCHTWCGFCWRQGWTR